MPPKCFEIGCVYPSVCLWARVLAFAGDGRAPSQWWEVRTDGLMHRTKSRPLPSGRVSPQGALCIAAGSGAAGTALLLAGTNPVVAALGLGNIVLYG
jgi:heme O synthase-like polyprenyltransferase